MYLHGLKKIGVKVKRDLKRSTAHIDMQFVDKYCAWYGLQHDKVVETLVNRGRYCSKFHKIIAYCSQNSIFAHTNIRKY